MSIRLQEDAAREKKKQDREAAIREAQRVRGAGSGLDSPACAVVCHNLHLQTAILSRLFSTPCFRQQYIIDERKRRQAMLERIREAAQHESPTHAMQNQHNRPTTAPVK